MSALYDDRSTREVFSRPKEDSQRGILSPGDMGLRLGRVLHAIGLDVLAALEGRSQLTRDRAIEAGFRDAGSVDGLVSQADIVLSILVPSEAGAVAEQVAGAMERTGAKPVFVECNAIAPRTVRSIEQTIAAAGNLRRRRNHRRPPRAPGGNTRFYCSGPDTSAFAALNEHGLDVRVVGPEIGQASGLKMVYAASTKGTTALWTELLAAARALGLEGTCWRVRRRPQPGAPADERHPFDATARPSLGRRDGRDRRHLQRPRTDAEHPHRRRRHVSLRRRHAARRADIA